MRAVRGGVSGLVATTAMSALMLVSERSGIMPGQPPRMMVDRVAPQLDDRVADALTLVSHAGYGAAAGAVYALLPLRPSARSGGLFGLALYTASYEGWVPLLHVLPPAHRDVRRRVLTMAAAHLLYGVVLGGLLRR